MPATTDIRTDKIGVKAKRFVLGYKRISHRYWEAVTVILRIFTYPMYFRLYRITGLVRRPLKAVIRVRVPLELYVCSHAEIGSQASLSRWCPMGVRVQVSLVALNYTLVAQLVQSAWFTPKGSEVRTLSGVLPPQWCNGSTRDCDSLSSSSILGWRTKLFYDFVVLARRVPSI